MIPRVFIPELKAPPALPAGGVVVSAGGETMGTTWSVRVVADDGDESAITAGVEGCLATVIAQMSPWIADSEITSFNNSPAGAWTHLSPQFHAVLNAALTVARQSDGAFDPTIGAVVDLWGFGPPGPVNTPPALAQVEAARGRAGWSRLRLEAGRVLQPGGLKLDLSGVAKGYAVDWVFETLVALGFDSLIVEIGGELRGAGIRPDGQPWWVDVEMPPQSTLEGCRLALHGLAIATSGDYRRSLAHEDQTFAHTLDPRTGQPVTHGLASVTVVSETAMTADAQATAIMVLGPEAGFAYAVAHGLAALLVYPEDGRWRERMTLSLAKMMA